MLEREPIAPDDPLIGMANVVLTPHAAFYSEESLAEMKRKVSERVLEALTAPSSIPWWSVTAAPGRRSMPGYPIDMRRVARRVAYPGGTCSGPADARRA